MGFQQPEEREQELTVAKAQRARKDPADSINPSTAKAISRWLAPSNVGALYVWVILIGVFAIWIPNLFFSYKTVASIVNQNSISAIMAFSLLIPLSAGVFDLSIGSVMGLAGLLAAKLLGYGSINPYLVILVVLVASALIGAVNALVVVGLGVDSFIGTLATGSILAAVTLGISNEQILTNGVYGTFSNVATRSIDQIQQPFIYSLVLAIIIWYFLSRTTGGRRLYAVGYNADAAKLAGITVGRARAMSLMASATVAGLGGILLTAVIGAADPTAGPSYLIPAFSAAFLGATQFSRHLGGPRFNPQGTFVAILMLGTGSTGLLLAGAPQWAPQLFEGVILIIAVALTVGRRKRA